MAGEILDMDPERFGAGGTVELLLEVIVFAPMLEGTVTTEEERSECIRESVGPPFALTVLRELGPSDNFLPDFEGSSVEAFPPERLDHNDGRVSRLADSPEEDPFRSDRC